MEEKSEHTPKIQTLCSQNFASLFNFLSCDAALLVGSICVCHPHKHSSAAIIPAVSVAAGNCCICAQLCLSDWSSHKEGQVPGMPWDGSSVCALSLHK